MINTIISRALTGIAMLGLALVLFTSAPQSAHAWYDCGCYGYNYSYHSYPPAPTYYNTPSVQVTYSNGYYQNYFVPTVRYFPAPYPTPVPTTYYPTQFQPPVYNHYGYGGGYRNW